MSMSPPTSTSTSTSTSAVHTSSTALDSTVERTRGLLIGGAVAGPLFTIVGLIQAFTRPGFDIRRHAFSLLENGDLGWIQIASFIVTGVLFVGAGLGMRQVMRGTLGGTWGPRLIVVFGLGMLGAGLFTADPGLGYPPGTPADANPVSWHGLVHVTSASFAFLALTAAGLVWARRHAAERCWGWAVYSLASVVVFFASFAGLASGQLYLNLAFVLTALNAFVWVSVVAAQLLVQQERG